MDIAILDEFYNGARAKAAELDAFADKHQLAGAAQVDHIGFKCDSSETFERIRKLFELDASAYVYQSIIAGRRIAYIKLRQGITTKLGIISFFELSDQKPDKSQTNKFDHLEIYPVGITYEQLVAKLSTNERIIHVERPHHTTDDIKLESGFLIRLTREPLIDKIKNEEMR